MIEKILEKAKGRKGCPTCDGTGQYEFMGCRIFCLCIGEENITNIWQGIDSSFGKSKKSVPQKAENVWASNKKYLGFEAAEEFDRTRTSWKKLGSLLKK